MANNVYRELQALTQPSPWVELFTLDTTNLGGTTYYMTPNIYTDGNSVVWQGHTYVPLPIQIQGWEVVSSAAGQGSTQPRPIISVTNVNRQFLSAVISLGDLVGATFTRVRTYTKFLDGQPSADTTEYVGPDIYKIIQKTSHTKTVISWQMASLIDIPGKFLPARQVLKDATTLSAGFPGVAAY